MSGLHACKWARARDARKARHLDGSEVIVFGIIRAAQAWTLLPVFGAAVEERRHELALLFFLAVLE